MREHAFDFDPTAIRSGQVLVRLRNAGAVAHELSVVGLPADAPPLEDQLRSAEPSALATIAILRARPPGATGTFALALSPGRYAFICVLKDADGTTHAAKGMVAEFAVT